MFDIRDFSKVWKLQWDKIGIFSYSVERGGRSVALLAMMFAYDFYHSGAILKAEGTRKWMVIDDGYLLLGSNAYKGKNDCIIMTMVNGRHYDSSFLVTYSENWALGNNTFSDINKISQHMSQE